MFIGSGKKRENSKMNLCIDYMGLYISFLQFRGKDFMFPMQSVNYNNGIKKKRGTHFCAPVFGKASEKSGLNEKMPQHGFLRNMRFNLDRINESVAETKFDIKQTDGYPWKIKGEMVFICKNDELLINASLLRAWNCTGKDLAPINFGFHPYWVNKNGASVFTDNYSGPVDRIIVPSYHLKYLGPVHVKLHGIGSVKITMDGDLKDPEVVLWSDHRDFLCVEPVIANAKKFGTPEGIMLERGEEIKTSFRLQFKNK